MSTQAKFGIELPGGKVRASGVHFDGYPEGAGFTLLHHYKSEVKINKLIDLGYLRVLQPSVEPDSQAPHGLRGDAQPGVTEAYGRDGGREDWEGPEEFESVSAYFEAGGYQAYTYLYTQEGEWLVSYEYDDQMPCKIQDFKPQYNEY